MTACTWIASVAVPGSSVALKVALTCVAEKTSEGALAGALLSGGFSCIKAVLEGKSGDDLILDTLDGAGNGCVIGAVAGLVSGAVEGKNLYDSYTAAGYDKFESTFNTVQNTGKPPEGVLGGRPYANRSGALPEFDSLGKHITYQEYDVNMYIPGQNRGAERLVIGSDGRGWKTTDHYRSFTQIK